MLTARRSDYVISRDDFLGWVLSGNGVNDVFPALPPAASSSTLVTSLHSDNMG